MTALLQIDFTDLDNFAFGFPHSLFEVHRREAPVYWHAATENTPDGEGFCSVATHAETLAVFRDPETFSSVTGGSRFAISTGFTASCAPFSRLSTRPTSLPNPMI